MIVKGTDIIESISVDHTEGEYSSGKEQIPGERLLNRMKISKLVFSA